MIAPGEAFYMTPGHTPAAIAGTEFVQFSPTDELAVSEAVWRRTAGDTRRTVTKNRFEEVERCRRFMAPR